MQRVVDFFGGLYELLRLGVVTGFRFKGHYWSWRLHTVFGRGYPESKKEMVGAVLAYGRWVYRLRRAR